MPGKSTKRRAGLLLVSSAGVKLSMFSFIEVTVSRNSFFQSWKKRTVLPESIKPAINTVLPLLARLQSATHRTTSSVTMPTAALKSRKRETDDEMIENWVLRNACTLWHVLSVVHLRSTQATRKHKKRQVSHYYEQANTAHYRETQKTTL